MEDKPLQPGYAALRRHRSSKAQAEYFLTINLKRWDRGLESPQLTEALRSGWRELEFEGFWLIRTAVVMADHVHVLACLKGGETLAGCVRLFKGRLAAELRGAGVSWQPGFYEHQLRSEEDLTPVFFYIYLNPYRAGLLPRTDIWHGYYCRAEDWVWFGSLTVESAPQPEWLR